MASVAVHRAPPVLPFHNMLSPQQQQSANSSTRASHVLPTVKCTSCALPVPLSLLADHVCLPPKPMPALPPPPIQTTAPLRPRARSSARTPPAFTAPAPAEQRPAPSILPEHVPRSISPASISSSSSHAPSAPPVQRLPSPVPPVARLPSPTPLVARLPSPTPPAARQPSPIPIPTTHLHPTAHPPPPPDTASGGSAGMAGVGRRAFAAMVAHQQHLRPHQLAPVDIPGANASDSGSFLSISPHSPHSPPWLTHPSTSASSAHSLPSRTPPSRTPSPLALGAHQQQRRPSNGSTAPSPSPLTPSSRPSLDMPASARPSLEKTSARPSLEKQQSSRSSPDHPSARPSLDQPRPSLDQARPRPSIEQTRPRPSLDQPRPRPSLDIPSPSAHPIVPASAPASARSFPLPLVLPPSGPLSAGALPSPTTAPKLPFFEKYKQLASKPPPTQLQPQPQPPSPPATELAYAAPSPIIPPPIPPSKRPARSPTDPGPQRSSASTASSSSGSGSRSATRLEASLMETLLEEEPSTPPTPSSTHEPPERLKLPQRSRTTPTSSCKSKEREREKEKEKERTCVKCGERIANGRWVQREGAGVLCERDWKEMYLPKCRRCELPIEKHAVSSSDGQLKGKYHRECFSCDTCREPFPDKTFYVFDGRPYCAYHYHSHNNSLCAHPDCGQPIEGACAITHTGARFHPAHLVCDDPGCDERLAADYWEVGGRKLCERHGTAALRSLRLGEEREGREEQRAARRKTRFVDLVRGK